MMDFASLLKSQIDASKPSSTSDTGKKYLKRSELEAQRQADYQREQEDLERARVGRIEKKRKRDEDETERDAAREAKRKRLAEESKKLREAEEEAEENARRKRLGLPELVKQSSEEPEVLKNGEKDDIPDEELLQKLKDLDEPRKLFGETHVQRLRRYKTLTGALMTQRLSTGPIPTTLALVEEKDMKVPAHVPADAEDRRYVLRQLASYFDMVLSEWQAALSRRPTEVKESFAGRQAHSSFLAALSNLKPLFTKLESSSLPNALLAAVLEIAHLAQSKRYVDANDAYLRVSIGKAAWPIGVTMVGIHERSAREKLHETEKTGNQAHILADEVTRKMLQGIKRCLSFAQTRWPPEDLGQLMG